MGKEREAPSEAQSSIADSLVREIAQAPPVPIRDFVGQTVGRYRVLALLGAGGMGRVYEAEDLELGRRVAIKFVRATFVTRPERVGLFVRERTVTAELEHPAIIPIYDSGVAPSGELYYVMRKVSGESFDRLIAAEPTLRGRLGLIGNVIAVADAVAFAHARLIVHRDLKPSNVLVAAFGETLVADWGLAKRLGGPDDGGVVGTRAYMAPEQAAGKPVDERADVYAIGAILRHVITGRAPDDAPLGEIKDREVSAEAAADLVAIANKATAADPAARYASASELAAELRRFQMGQLVSARDYTRVEVLRRWARRHRVEVILGAALAVVLAIGGAVSVVRVVKERNAALAAQRESAERNENLVLLQARAELARDPTASIAWLTRYPARAPRWEDAAGIATDAWSRGVARQVWDLGTPLGSVAFSPDGTTIGVGAPDGSFFLIDVATGARRAFHVDGGVGAQVLFSPDGTLVATTDGRGPARLWERATGASRLLPGGKTGGPRLQFSPDGTKLRTRHADGPPPVWRIPSGEPVPLPEGVALFTFAPEGDAFAVTRGDRLELWDGASNAPVAGVRFDGVASEIAVLHGGEIAIALGDALGLWNPSTGRMRRVPAPHDTARLVVASPDGRSVVSCGVGGTDLRLFDVPAGTSRVLSAGEACTWQTLSFSPDSALFLSSGFVDEVRVHDVVEGGARHLRGHQGGIADAAWSKDGRWVASVSTDGAARVWRIGEGDVVLHGMPPLDTMSDDGKLLLANISDGAVSAFDASIGVARPLSGPRRRADVQRHGALSADGRTAAFPEDDGTFAVWDLSRMEKRTVGRQHPLVATEALSPDGGLYAEVDDRGALTVTDTKTGAQRTVGTIDDRGFMVTWSADGRAIATAGRDGTARVFDLDGHERGRLRANGWVWSVAFSRDGTRVAAGSNDGAVRVLDLASGRVHELRGHIGLASAVAFLPDRERLVSGGTDGTLRLWDLRTGRGSIVFREPGPIDLVTYPKTGTRVMIRSGSKTRLWDVGVLPAPDAGPEAVAAWAAGLTTAKVDDHGRLRSP